MQHSVGLPYSYLSLHSFIFTKLCKMPHGKISTDFKFCGFHMAMVRQDGHHIQVWFMCSRLSCVPVCGIGENLVWKQEISNLCDSYAIIIAKGQWKWAIGFRKVATGWFEGPKYCHDGSLELHYLAENVQWLREPAKLFARAKSFTCTHFCELGLNHKNFENLSHTIINTNIVCMYCQGNTVCYPSQLQVCMPVMAVCQYPNGAAVHSSPCISLCNCIHQTV